MIKHLVFVRTDRYAEPNKFHYVVRKDGVIASLCKLGDDERRLFVCVDCEKGDEISLTQLRAMCSLGMASAMQYGLAKDDVECINLGLDWEEIVRRGR